MTLVDALADCARRSAAKRAMTFLEPKRAASTYTFERLYAAAGALADRVTGHRLDRRAPVGILVESQESQVLHYLALLVSGHVPAILTPPSRKFDRAFYTRTMRGVLSRCGFAAIITDLTDLDPSIRVLRPFTLDSSGPVAQSPPDDCSGAAFLQFSSGTTGMKRGVVIDHAAALAQIDSCRQAVDLVATDCIVSWLPLYHDMGFITALNMPLAVGTPVVMMRPLDWVADPALYLNAVSQYRGTIGWHPNFAFAFMAERVTDDRMNATDLTSLRALVNCSESVTHSAQERFLHRFARFGLRQDVFHGCYGMAEMTFALTAARSGDESYLDHLGPNGPSAGSIRKPVVSVGKPIRGVELRIVTDDGTALEDREIGEVWARAPFAFRGYYNNPDATAKVFDGQWYRSGDMGYRVGDALFICGRRNDLLIVNGVNVYPQDVEEIVSGVPGLKSGRVVAFAVFDATAGTDRIVVLAEPEGEAEPYTCAIEARRRLSSALQLSGFDVEIVPPAWLVKSSAGKIARDVNRRKWLESSVERAGSTPLDGSRVLPPRSG